MMTIELRHIPHCRADDVVMVLSCAENVDDPLPPRSTSTCGNSERRRSDRNIYISPDDSNVVSVVLYLLFCKRISKCLSTSKTVAAVLI